MSEIRIIAYPATGRCPRSRKSPFNAIPPPKTGHVFQKLELTLRTNVESGGLISYFPDHADLFRRTAGYVDRILKGTKPGELPMEQPTRYYLFVNLKTAQALGITIPQSILLRADKVIE